MPRRGGMSVRRPCVNGRGGQSVPEAGGWHFSSDVCSALLKHCCALLHIAACSRADGSVRSVMISPVFYPR